MKPLLQILSMLLLTAGLTTSLTAQSWGNKTTINGEGPMVKERLNVEGFTSIGLGMQATVYLTQGSSYSVEIEAQKNIIDALKKEVDDDSWNIGFEDNIRVRNYKKATIWITMPTLQDVAIGGSGEIYGKTPFRNLGNMKISIAGSGEIELAGDAKDTKLSIAGSGTIKAKDLKVASAKISIAGSGNTYIFVDDGDLDVSVAGSGKVFYKGRASIKTSIAGSGSVSTID